VAMAVHFGANESLVDCLQLVPHYIPEWSYYLFNAFISKIKIWSNIRPTVIRRGNLISKMITRTKTITKFASIQIN